MESTIRPAIAGDAVGLRQLQAALTEPAPQLLDAAITQLSATDDTNTHSKATSIQKGFTLLVSVDEADIAVGYLLAFTGETTHIAELAVDPAYRREGRAKALLATVIDQTTDPITVHVAVDNTAAIALYRSIGFQECARSDDRFEHAAGLTLRYPPAER
ncbi:MAG: acetyltransferase [Halonotius sp. J07HN4]|nr:MAG: acetyltransferase [Halonotius sp. J07HN4]